MNLKKIFQPALALTFAFTLACTSCSTGPQLERDETAQATLDYKNNRIITPLEEYNEIFDENSQYYTQALEILRQRCFAKHGQSYEIYIPDIEDIKINSSGREFGLWNPEYSAKYGNFKRSGNAPSSAGYDTKIMEQCMPEISATMKEIAGISIEDQSGLSETYRRIYGQSYAAAMNHPEWKKYREAWWKCLSDKGLTPRKGDEEWETQELSNATRASGDNNAPASEEEIRLSVIEAQCSKDTGMAQGLANLVASYQKPLIRDNETKLEEQRQQQSEVNLRYKEWVLKNQ